MGGCIVFLCLGQDVGGVDFAMSAALMSCNPSLRLNIEVTPTADKKSVKESSEELFQYIRFEQTSCVGLLLDKTSWAK